MAMKKWFLPLLLLTLLISPIVYGHTPLGTDGENNSIENAVEISTPTKSWTVYRELHEVSEVEYFKLHLKVGERFKFSVYTPRNQETSFVPSAVVMWPGIVGGDAPIFVEIPLGYGAKLIEGVRPPAPRYEPFTPTSYHFVVDYDQPVQKEDDYYIAVFSSNTQGKYGIAVGYVEEFTALEWLKIPLDLIGIHLWEGESLMLVFGPLAASIIVGVAIMVKRFGIGWGLVSLVGSIAGFLNIGSGLMTLTQLVLAVSGAVYDASIIITIVFTIVPILLGFLILRQVASPKKPITTGSRVVLIILGVIGFVFWAGLLVGPVLTLLAAVLPAYSSEQFVGWDKVS